MRHLNARMVFVCLAALLLVVGCADTEKKTTEAPSQAAEATIEEVALNVTGMT